MKILQSNDEEERIKWKWRLFTASLILAFFASGYVLWNLATLAKIRFLGRNPFDLYPWTYIFFRPIEGNLINYCIVSLYLGFCGLSLYLLRNRISLERLSEFLRGTNLGTLVLVILLALGMLGWAVNPSSLGLRIAKMSIVACLPFFMAFLNGSFFSKLRDSKRKWIFLALVLLGLVSIEPIIVAKGPVFLMNEYVEVFNDTFIRGTAVSNKEYLERLSTKDIDTVKVFYDLKNKIENIHTDALAGEDIDFLRNYKFIDLAPAQRYIEALSQVAHIGESKITKGGMIDIDQYIKNLPRIDVESIKDFYLANLLENLHQTMGRGQMNHIGHIINPINEYELGKPIKDIYFQYGIGYTFLLKWIMERLGGLSIENYYKTYILYIIYFASYLLLLLILFSDRIYVFAAFGLISVCFYYMGYIALVLAPGINPGVHLLDLPVLLCLFLFFQGGRTPYAIFAAALSLLSIVINRNFGIALCVSCLVSTLLYAFEFKDAKKKYYGIGGCLLYLGLTIYFFILSDVGSGSNVFPYYLYGFYSWPVPSFVIVGTILYLIASYSFILLLKGHNFYWKYFYVLVFIYAQIVLTYYFWSGLPNHLPPVLIFVGLQCFVGLYIIEKYFALNWRTGKWVPSLALRGAILGLIMVSAVAGLKFIREKSWFQQNFLDHPVYQWEFDRARLVSTINPRIIEENIFLIKKYTNSNDPGIYIISRYDGLFPFLAHRYSAMPFFEMISFVFSHRERDDAIGRIKENKPKYLFVDTNILVEPRDRWAILNNSEFFQKERAAHFGRHEILRQIFLEVSDEYEKIEEGGVISVYKRK